MYGAGIRRAVFRANTAGTLASVKICGKNMDVEQKKNPALGRPGSRFRFESWRRYCADKSVQEVRLGGLTTTTALTTPFDVIVVDGNHGGAKPPCE
jgi:hypothetical protein